MQKVSFQFQDHDIKGEFEIACIAHVSIQAQKFYNFYGYHSRCRFSILLLLCILYAATVIGANDINNNTNPINGRYNTHPIPIKTKTKQ